MSADGPDRPSLDGLGGHAEVLHEDEEGSLERFASLAGRQFMDSAKFDRARRELIEEFLQERKKG